MIERVHEHLIGELKQNTRTDTVFILAAIVLNLTILGINSAVGSIDATDYEPKDLLTVGSHKLQVEVRTAEGWWEPAGSIDILIDFSAPPAVAKPEESSGSSWIWHIPSGSQEVRYQIDDRESAGWAVHLAEESRDTTLTSVMFIFIVLSIFLNLAVIFGLLKGKKMRSILLGSLIRMYKDQKVDAYYDEALLSNYSIRYYIFISIVVFIGIISIIVPLVLKYL